MSNEMRVASQPAGSVYGIIYNPTSLVWSGASFNTYVSGDYSNYVRTMTELGGSGVYTGNFPVAITTPAAYEVIYYLANGTPAEGDLIIGTQSVEWDGSGIEILAVAEAGFISGTDWLTYVLRAFKRTDKNTEVFDATKDTIDNMRLRLKLSEDETQVDLTDQITVLGEYRMDLESDFGHLVGDITVQDGNYGWSLDRISKAEWDARYLSNVTDSTYFSTPKHFAVYGGQIYIGPAPDLITYVYKSSYTKDDRGTITASTTAVPFTDKYREILRLGTLQRLFSDIVKNDDQAAKFGTLYENGLRGIMQREDENRGTTFQMSFGG